MKRVRINIHPTITPSSKLVVPSTMMSTNRGAKMSTTLFFSCVLAFLAGLARAEDPYLFFTWHVTYGTRSPLGVPQQVILINDQFPGPKINCTSNNNIVVNVFNQLDEPFLLSWHGIQQRKNSWQDGTLGTMCPIPPGTNYTYHFQVKDQIGTYFYYPTTALHRAAGGMGPITVYSRLLIPVPFEDPEDDYVLLIGDWFVQGHKELKKHVDSGKTLPHVDGILINGKLGTSKADDPMFTMKPGKTYRYRMCNIGSKHSINFRIQGHDMKLVELEGSHTIQNIYSSLDLHLGQCYSVLVTANKEPKDYYMVASTRFSKQVLMANATIRYENSKGAPASKELPPPPPTGSAGVAWSVNQFRSFRWNLTASAARPNPQGSYHYGKIPITRTIKIANSYGTANGKLRFTVNGISHVDGETPLKLAEYFGKANKVFKYDLMADSPPEDFKEKVTMAPNVLNATWRNFVEIVFENYETSIHSWHIHGYSFFPVGIEPGRWSPEKRKNYNLVDTVSRYTIHVYPKSWAAILLTFDNAGMWNVRSMQIDRQYLGQQFYVSVLSPELSLRDEYNIWDFVELCGIVKGLKKPMPYWI